MSANSLHIELPPQERPSVLPWVIVLACAAILLVLVSQLASRIPESLQAQAQSIIDASTLTDLRVRADGRNLDVSGNILVNNSIGPVIDQMKQITGVRHIRDTVIVVDPTVQKLAQARQFAQQLAAIDTSSVDFKPGSIAFTPDSDAALSQLLALLQQYPEGRVRIEGHTDTTGADTVNLRVSRDRAAAVANYLVARGVSSDQLIIIGYGSTQPIADNNTETGRASNRRIEINLVQ